MEVLDSIKNHRYLNATCKFAKFHVLAICIRNSVKFGVNFIAYPNLHAKKRGYEKVVISPLHISSIINGAFNITSKDFSFYCSKPKYGSFDLKPSIILNRYFRYAFPSRSPDKFGIFFTDIL